MKQEMHMAKHFKQSEIKAIKHIILTWDEVKSHGAIYVNQFIRI